VSDRLVELQEQTFSSARAVTASSFEPARRLTADQLGRFLDRRVFAVLSTTRADGRPHAALGSYYRRDDVFWLPTARDSIRERHVRRQPWLVLVVTEGDHGAHVMVTVEGPVEIVPVAAVPADVAAEVEGDWVELWLKLTAQRVLSYGAEGADL
jgi:hypothetical protein